MAWEESHDMDERFWAYADDLVRTHRIVLDRPRGTAHPRLPDVIYPFDYGYLEGTTASDGGGIDVWLGSLGSHCVTGAIVTLDLAKCDAEIKLLVACTLDEAHMALSTHNSHRQAGLLVLRGS